MPAGLLAIAVFAVGLGVLGLWSSIAGLAAGNGVSFDAETLVAEVRGSLGPETQRMIDEVMPGDDLPRLAAIIAEGAAGLDPHPRRTAAVEGALALLSLAAGVGLLARRRWGKGLMIAFIMAATAAAVVFGWQARAGAALMLERLAQEGYLDPDQAATYVRSLGTLWLSLSAILVLLHAGLVWHLAARATDRWLAGAPRDQ